VVIWLADFASYQDQNLGTLEDAPRAGTSLLGVNSRCLDPVLEHLLGLDFKSLDRADDYLRVTRPQFITREVAQKKDMPDVSENQDRSWMRTARSGGSVQGLHPVLAVNQLGQEISGVWMGAAHIVALRESPYWRSLFSRPLVWSLGYVILWQLIHQER